MPQHSSSFTTTAVGGLLRALKNRCGISIAFDPRTPGPHPPAVEFDAIWDTGATNSVVTQRVVDACGLLPIGMTKVSSASSEDVAEVFLVNIYLPNRVVLHAVRVTKANLPASDADILIGMDVITTGDFAVTNKNGITKFSFRIPSLADIDFVVEHNRKAKRRAAIGFGKRRKGRKNKRRK